VAALGVQVGQRVEALGVGRRPQPGARRRLVAEGPLERRARGQQLAQPPPVGVQPVDVRQDDAPARHALSEQQVQAGRGALRARVDARDHARARLPRGGRGGAQHALLDRGDRVPDPDETEDAGPEAASGQRVPQAGDEVVGQRVDAHVAQPLRQRAPEVGARAGDDVHAGGAGDLGQRRRGAAEAPDRRVHHRAQSGIRRQAQLARGEPRVVQARAGNQGGRVAQEVLVHRHRPELAGVDRPQDRLDYSSHAQRRVVFDGSSVAIGTRPTIPSA
jgi:hypothetical protein